MKIVISSGHGLHIRGARGLIDEVDEARRVTDRVAAILQESGIDITAFHENEARTQADNVNAIVRFHNSQQRDLDVSIHFNSTATGHIEDRAIGVEVLYRTGNEKTRILAGRVARGISDASGLLLRHMQGSGALARANLGFLNNTTAAAILVEVCFVVSRTDVGLYQLYFEEICQAIAAAVSGQSPISMPLDTATEAASVASPVDEAACIASSTITSTSTITEASRPPNSWAQEAWEWGVKHGFTNGTNPRGSATREQMLTVLHRYHLHNKVSPL